MKYLYYNMDETWKHAEWNKSITKHHILCDTFCMKYLSKLGKSTEPENRLLGAKVWEERGMEINYLIDMGFLLEREKMF